MNTSESRAEKPYRPAMMRRSTRLIAAVAAGIMGISMVGLTALPASADTRPVDPTSPASPVTASPDVLPTVQIDGVVWQQTVIGNTVYAVGQFSTARPAGAAPGVNTTPRNNILAFDIRTGALITSFNASLNGMAKTVTASPDGKRVYVGGAFTQVNGVDRRFVAALDSTTGALITSFAPLVNSRVYAVQATENAIYMGGWFSGVGSAKRDKLAAVAPSNAALLPWNPVVAGGDVTSLLVSPDRTKVVAAGNFTSVNGSTNPGAGWAAINTTTSALEPWLANSEVRNSGLKASITGLSGDANYVYASGYDFDGVGGAFEGVVAARWSDGGINWLEDCHGDTYGVWAAQDVVYSVSHAHYCGNVQGFPETTPKRSYNHALAFGKTPVATVTRDTQGYRNFEGYQHSALLNWWPTFDIGRFTGQNQATWAVTGNSEYVVMGGEFPTVSGTRQQGLVRFGVGTKSTNNVAPEIRGAAFNPNVISVRPGEARISWGANWDRDNRNLTYRVYKNGNLTTPIFETTKDSTFWQLPTMTFTDKGLEPGSKQLYRVFAVDAFGNEARSDNVEVTVASGDLSPYATTVLDDSPTSFWRFGEPSGTAAIDYAGADDLTVGAGVTRGAEGAASQDADKASVFNGTDTGLAAGKTPAEAPNTYTSEAWIKTTTTSGGKIIGYGSSSTGNSPSYDRQTYMDNEGRIWFGVYPNTVRTLNSTKSYNDGQWHHVVTSLGPAGMSLYVDGVLIGKRADTTSGQTYQGVWRVGGDNLGGWPNQPASYYFNGTIDDVAVYPTELSRSQIQEHYTASGREVAGPKKPADAYGAAVYTAEPDFFWRLNETSGSTAADASLAESPGTYVSGTTLGQNGALEGVADKAVGFDGSSGLLSSNARYDNPTTYSQELWFNTTTTNGGKLIGFGDNPNGLSNNYDRHVYMENDGRLTFGVWTGQTNLAQSEDAYNDGQWHHMVATQSSAGMVLYVDGEVVGTNPQTGAQGYSGHWKIGGDVTWGPQPYFGGTIDEVAVYSRALPASEVASHYRLGSGTTAPPVPNQAPVAAATVTPENLTVAADGSASTDSDGTIGSYSWNFGDNSDAVTGATASHTYAAAGTYQVVLTVTDDKGATSSVTKSVTVTAPPVANQAPVAASTVTAENLTVAADGSASSDPDGTVASYSWNFGDNSAAETGATTSHTYAAAGTYQVVLTVTDDDGATNSVTKQVTVTAPPVPNKAPVAAATVTAQNLSVTADGSASSDSDGTLASYSWNFGDNSPAKTGATTTYTYAAAGTYQVVLTVTDDDGATNSVTKQVTVAAAPGNQVLSNDAFDRTVSNGWGTALTGGAWTVPNFLAPNLSVANGAGAISTVKGNTIPVLLNGTSAVNSSTSVVLSSDKVGDGGGFFASVIGRKVGTAGDYRAKMWISKTGAVTMELKKKVGSTETKLAGGVLPGLTYAAGEKLNVKFEVKGQGSTTLAVKVWRVGAAEPAAWQYTAVDTTAELQASGVAGLETYLSGSATNGPVVLRVDDWRSVAP